MIPTVQYDPVTGKPVFPWTAPALACGGEVGAPASPAERPFHVPVVSIVGGLAAGLKWGPVTGLLTFGGLYMAGPILIFAIYGILGGGKGE